MLRIPLPLLVLLLATPAGLAAQAPAPNVILINVDDVGYGDLGAYGQALINTPRIDSLAARGIRFVNFYAAAPVCGPSRASLLTARHAGRIGSCGNSQANLAATFPLWPQRLRDAGYVTGQFGKQHRAGLQGETVVADSPRERGFQEFLGWLNAIDAHQFYLDGATVTPGWARRPYLFRSEEGGVTVRYDVPPDRYVHAEFIEGAADFLRRHADTSFFLYLPLTIAHAELALPGTAYPATTAADSADLAQYLDPAGNSIFPEFDYRGDGIYGRPNPFRTRATLAAMISRLDRDVGRIVDLVDSLGLTENTLLLLTSDNGAHDEGGVDPEQLNGSLDSPFNSTGGLRGFKRSLYEGGVRVPFIAYWPGRLTPRTDSTLLGHIDVGPTLLDLAGAPPLPGIDGNSFRSVLAGGAEAIHTDLYWQFGNQQSLRRGRFKAYRGMNNGPTDAVELYDVHTDPAETTDLAADPAYAGILATLKRRMNEENAGSACGFVPLALGDAPPVPPVPAAESLNYLPGGLSGRGTATDGWAGPWTLITGPDPAVREGGITVPGLAAGQTVSTSGNRLELRHEAAGSNARLVRRLRERYPDDGSVYWLGYWQESTIAVARNVFQVALVNVAAYGPTGPGGQLLRVGKDFGQRTLGFAGGPQSDIAAEAAHFVVLRVATSGDGNPETVHLFVDPDPREEPAPATAALTTTVDLSGGFDGIGIKLEGTPGITGSLDDVYLGLRYPDIVADDLRFGTSTRHPARRARLAIHPNPAHAELVVTPPRPLTASATLYTATGARARGWTIGLPGRLDVRGLPPGAYWLRVEPRKGEGAWVERVIIR